MTAEMAVLLALVPPMLDDRDRGHGLRNHMRDACYCTKYKVEGLKVGR